MEDRGSRSSSILNRSSILCNTPSRKRRPIPKQDKDPVMVIPSRRLLFCLAVSGWFGTAASAQEELFFTPASEPVPAPATEFTVPETIVSEPAVVVADPTPPATSIQPV